MVVAGFAGADPRDLIVFGVKPSGDWEVVVFGVAVILAHLYWYILRYDHLKEDGKIEQDPSSGGALSGYLKITWNDYCLVRKGADLFSNYAAALLTAVSWHFVASWILDGS